MYRFNHIQRTQLSYKESLHQKSKSQTKYPLKSDPFYKELLKSLSFVLLWTNPKMKNKYLAMTLLNFSSKVSYFSPFRCPRKLQMQPCSTITLSSFHLELMDNKKR
uniref:Uncharacterized protein n=1 Tax=Nelumbo nucifera TaxID=4432 RepID=A0A822YXB7_NELNU|nr:TPA_asm: hypothetical protein HUJ06_013036 [Nelumbo nucifera]